MADDKSMPDRIEPTGAVKATRPQDEKLTVEDIENVSGGVTGFRPRFRRYIIVDGEMVPDPNDDGQR